MPDTFAGHNSSLDSPPRNGFAISPSDSVDMANATRFIYVGGAGAVALITTGGDTVTFPAVPVGTTLRICAARVKSTGTTATNLVGLY